MQNNNNPLLKEFHIPPFGSIQMEHYLPAIKELVSRSAKAISTITENQQTPTFENTIEALEFASYHLERVTTLFFNLNHADTSQEMQNLALEISPIVTQFSNDISLNRLLFERVSTVFNNRENETLTKEQLRLLEKTYTGFIRKGASLSDSDKTIFREITEELSKRSLQFSQNLLGATAAYHLHIEDEKELVGMPDYVIEMGRSEAISKEKEGWIFTLQAPSYIPFLQFCQNRTLREELWNRYNSRCFDRGEFDNQAIVKRIAELRLRFAQLMGHENYSGYALETRMSKTQQKVEEFLNNLITRTKPFAQKDWQTIASYAKSKGLQEELMPWDFAFYCEKYKKEFLDISDEMLKPYFPLESVQAGLFDTITSLYGVTFHENKAMDRYHNDIVVYDVMEGGKLISHLMIDYFPRDSKSGGAWMTTFAERAVRGAVVEIPIVSLVCNFSLPTQSSPSLLTFNEVTTLFHEAGHALHAIFATGNYPSISSTNVAWDFVELPSQIMENWAIEKEFLSKWAKHYQSGEKISEELIDKLIASDNFMSGFSQMRQLSFGAADMGWHTISKEIDVSVKEFETEALKETQIAPKVSNNCVSTTFSHIFAGGYAAGYYSYKWAEVLEADAFSMFKEMGAYNKEVAKSFRENILSKGDLEDPMQLYIKFRGREPKTDALFTKLGMTTNE